jgi:hypothetical protein
MLRQRALADSAWMPAFAGMTRKTQADMITLKVFELVIPGLTRDP